MKKLGNIIKQIRKSQKKTLAQVADEVKDYDAGNLSRFENGKQDIANDKLEMIASSLGMKMSELYALAENTNSNYVKEEYANYTVLPARNIKGTVPLISWVQAGGFNECIDNLGECERISTDCEIREHTFALKVKGDSMTSDGRISFPEGIIIIVEPSIQAINGDFVIAINGDNEATFKQLIKDGVDWYLKPLNNRYPLKPLGTSSIIGVVRQAVMNFK